MNLNKFTLFMEKLWLVIAILTSIYAIYMIFSGETLNSMEYVLPIVAFVLFYTRRTIRRKLESAASNQDPTIED